jgi:plastocyanin
MQYMRKWGKKSMKRLFVLLVALGFVLVFVASCGRSASASAPTSTPGSSGGGGNVTDVHMGVQSFLQSSITIKKGDSLNLVNDASDIHLIGLGQWVNGSPKPETEPGAPQVQSLEFTGPSSHVVGPWNTPGTYHLYCTIHQNMQLTVIVQ